ncbi:MAG TPA: 4Fe-4S binding protein [Herpetosiphonaceae bacterium]|nr:4Fe-4S binding protein [Herpetosiphonaceae bacterium]
MPATPEQPWSLPRIDRERCTGCANCAELCPVQAVAIVNGIAEIVRPEACTFCDRCERFCPEEAIGRPFVIRFASPAARGQ